MPPPPIQALLDDFDVISLPKNDTQGKASNSPDFSDFENLPPNHGIERPALVETPAIRKGARASAKPSTPQSNIEKNTSSSTKDDRLEAGASRSSVNGSRVEPLRSAGASGPRNRARNAKAKESTDQRLVAAATEVSSWVSGGQ